MADTSIDTLHKDNIESVEAQNVNDVSKDSVPLAETENIFKLPELPSLKKQLTDENADVDLTKEPSQNVPYTPPEWQCTPSVNNGVFTIEVIKNGTIVETIRLCDLKNETFLSVGRFPPCEILLDHPSVSRYHCVLQYGKMAGRCGWFLYDLGSTHGTRLNKQSVKKHVYTPLRSGYVFQFAGSTRIFSFCGQEEDEEVKPSQPVASVKLALENREQQNEMDVNDDGFKYYEKDPLGWLDKYFEREGMSMSFDYVKAEKGAEWSCSIELPDIADGELIAASGITRKLAQFQCALQACLKLDVAGVLRNVTMWNKRANYAENDYYDSDEDTFFDRTGQLEAQRVKRRKRCEGDTDGTDSKSKTHNELVVSLNESNEKLSAAKSEIVRLLGKNCYTDGDGNVISTSKNFSTRMTISQMRSKEKRLIEECKQLEKLVALTKPRDLNKMIPANKILVTEKNKLTKPATIKQFSNVEVKDHTTDRIKSNLPFLPETEEDETDMSEKKFDKNAEKYNLSEAEVNNVSSTSKTNIGSESFDEKNNEETAFKAKKDETLKPTRVYQPASMPSDLIIMPKFGLITKEEARIKKPVLAKKRQLQIIKDELEDAPFSDYSDMKMQEDYTTWLPPQDQSGDGTTKLNKKFEGRY